jgi:hypothetical protein
VENVTSAFQWGLRHTLTILLVGCVASIGFPADAKTPSKLLIPRVSNAQVNYAKQYVFAACVLEAYRNTPLESEAEIWAGGIVSSSDLPLAVFKPLSELAKKAPPPKSSKPDEVNRKSTPMLMENCFNWHHSNTVSTAVQKLLREAQ